MDRPVLCHRDRSSVDHSFYLTSLRLMLTLVLLINMLFSLLGVLDDFSIC